MNPMAIWPNNENTKVRATGTPTIVASRNISMACTQVLGIMGAVDGIACESLGVEDPHESLLNGESDIAVCEASKVPYPLSEGLTIAALITANHPLQQTLAVLCRSDRADLRGLFFRSDIRNSYGKVWLVGAGPGSADLITLRALRALAQADIVYYDDLVDASLLAHSPGEHIYVGKRKGTISHSQDSINEMLYRSALEGKTVTRLKGGDPSIFGRAGEELDYLRRRWIAVEIVPGITSASAAAAAGLFPLTQRRISRSVTFLSGHGIDPTRPSAGKETFVYYMAASRLKEISHELLEKGVPSETAVAIICNAGAWNEASIPSTVEMMKDIVVHPPALVVVGKVAAYSLVEKKALFTGIDPSFVKVKEPIVHQPLVIRVPAAPFYKTVEPRPAPLDLSYFSSVIFSSSAEVDAFEKVYGELPDHLLLYAVGSETREALERNMMSNPRRIVPCPIHIRGVDGANGVIYESRADRRVYD